MNNQQFCLKCKRINKVKSNSFKHRKACKTTDNKKKESESEVCVDTSVCPSVHNRQTNFPLDSETACNGDFWSNIVFPKCQN